MATTTSGYTATTTSSCTAVSKMLLTTEKKPKKLRCAALNCPSTSDRVKFSRFPLDPERFKIWSKVAELKPDNGKKRHYLCAKHFRHYNFSANSRSPRRVHHSDPCFTTSQYMALQNRSDATVSDNGSVAPSASLPSSQGTRDTHNSVIREKEPPTAFRRTCKARNCPVTSRTHPNETFHPFPVNRRRFREWCRVAEHEDDGIHSNFFLCSRHFSPTSFEFRTPGTRSGKLKPHTVPVYRTGPLNPITRNYCPYVVEVVDDVQVIDSNPTPSTPTISSQNTALERTSPIVLCGDSMDEDPLGEEDASAYTDLAVSSDSSSEEEVLTVSHSEGLNALEKAQEYVEQFQAAPSDVTVFKKWRNHAACSQARENDSRTERQKPRGDTLRCIN